MYRLPAGVVQLLQLVRFKVLLSSGVLMGGATGRGLKVMRSRQLFLCVSIATLLVSGSYDKTVALWDMTSLSQTLSLKVCDRQFVRLLVCRRV